jgi:poly [ADP-ribose] polymerase
MLESLMDLEVAYSMMKVEDDGKSKKLHPVDQQYSKLKTTISVLEKSSDEFGHLLTYVKNTHAETHTNYDLDIMEVCIAFLKTLSSVLILYYSTVIASKK